MLTKNEFSLKFSKVSDFLGISPKRDFKLTKLASLSAPGDNAVLFIKELTPANLEKIVSISNCVIFLPETEKDNESLRNVGADNVLVYTENPRRDFTKLANRISDLVPDYFEEVGYSQKNGSWISNNAQIADSALIEPGCFIGHNTVIGSHSYIKSGVVISNNVKIGSHCVIGYNTVIGGHGFGGERDVDGFIYMLPHVGGAILEDHVYLGSFVTLVSGTMEPTTVGMHTKIDDHVHVAHNCQIGKSCFVTACAQFGGSDKAGDNVWIGPNASMMQGIRLGANSLVGLGAVVTKDVAADTTVIGNPAEELSVFVKNKKELAKLLNQKK